ncbi:hypothetical protein T10_7325 [Trichinella papuae]|uniref:Uncharacterized protein n=1 Tax=Trichinella papuae TaxID=268474 RepID=A0A0V1M115_9BILA|nr:hypothetical protein T10_7210 [Trichinella papuae]KRZ71587.1 hypothetical protein T10_13030 [Trichinella papuae]KRZ74369.1 hypothetical protein T10_7325 [Trichinella papuae]
MEIIIIAKSLIKRLESNRPIREKQTLYPWLIFHFDGVRLAVAVRNKSASEKRHAEACFV